MHIGYIRFGDFHLWVVPTMKTQQAVTQRELRWRTHECSAISAGHSMPNLFCQISGTSKTCPELALVIIVLWICSYIRKVKAFDTFTDFPYLRRYVSQSWNKEHAHKSWYTRYVSDFSSCMIDTSILADFSVLLINCIPTWPHNVILNAYWASPSRETRPNIFNNDYTIADIVRYAIVAAFFIPN